MKLTSKQIDDTLTQIEGEALPDSHPAVSQLNRVYGDHTFFVDDEGLHIVEAAEPADEIGPQAANVVRLASWTDEQHTTLVPHEPELTEIVIELAPEERH